MFILNKFKQFALLFGDITLLFISLYITLLIRDSQTQNGLVWVEHFYPFAIIYIIWILVFYSQNLYNLNLAKNNLIFFKTLIETFLINILIAAFFFYFTPFFGIAPKTNLFLNAIIAFALIASWRGIFNILAGKFMHKNRIAFLGYSKEVKELLTAFKNEPQLGYKTICIILDEKNPNIDIQQYTMDEFLENLGRLRLDTVAIHHNRNLDNEITAKLYRLIFSKITFVNFLKLYEEITGKLPMELLSQGWFLENLTESEKKIYDRLKVSIDYFLAFLIGVFLLALFPFVAGLILLTSGRPIFYKQERVGKSGKIFKIIKFRTMVQNAEKDGIRFAEKNDSRITGFGKFLRKTRIDELPQIINVLKGEMSFIGPRPERPQFVAELIEKMPFYQIRHLVKPGLTGWAQINYSYAGTIEENLKKLQYDIYYIKNRSLLVDITAILKTFNIILRFRGR